MSYLVLDLKAWFFCSITQEWIFSVFFSGRKVINSNSPSPTIFCIHVGTERVMCFTCTVPGAPWPWHNVLLADPLSSHPNQPEVKM